MKITKLALAGAFLFAGGALADNPELELAKASDIEILPHGGPVIDDGDSFAVLEASDSELLKRGGPMLRVFEASSLELFKTTRSGEDVVNTETRARAAERVEVNVQSDSPRDADLDVDVDVDTNDDGRIQWYGADDDIDVDLY